MSTSMKDAVQFLKTFSETNKCQNMKADLFREMREGIFGNSTEMKRTTYKVLSYNEIDNPIFLAVFSIKPTSKEGVVWEVPGFREDQNGKVFFDPEKQLEKFSPDTENGKEIICLFDATYERFDSGVYIVSELEKTLGHDPELVAAIRARLDCSR